MAGVFNVNYRSVLPSPLPPSGAVDRNLQDRCAWPMRPPRPSEGERRGPRDHLPRRRPRLQHHTSGVQPFALDFKRNNGAGFLWLEVENLLHLTDKEIRGMRMNFVDGSRGRLRTRPMDVLLPLTAARGEPPGSRDGGSERPPSRQRPRLSHRLQPLCAEAVTTDDKKNKTK